MLPSNSHINSEAPDRAGGRPIPQPSANTPPRFNAESPNERRHNLCISGIEKLALAGDAYAKCPNGWTSDQEERSVLT
jgi:hypothetical protein